MHFIENQAPMRLAKGLIQTMKKRPGILMSILLLLFVSVYPSFSFYTSNAKEMSLFEIIPVFCITLFISALVYIILFIITRKLQIASLLVVPFVLVFSYYQPIQTGLLSILPFLSLPTAAAVIVLLLIGLCVFAILKLRAESTYTLLKVCTLTMMGLILLNTVVAMPAILEKLRYSNQSLSTQNNAGEEEKELPNIYHFIFDEYAGFDIMKKYYDYDTEPFQQFLLDSGFTFSKNSFTHCHETWQCISSIYNLDYLNPYTSSDTNAKKREVIREGKLLEELSALGYTIRTVQAQNIFSVPSLLDVDVKNQLSESATGETSMEVLLTNTALYPYARDISDFISQWLMASGAGNGSMAGANYVTRAFDYFSDPNNFPMKNTFVAFYVNCPHVPFQFDEKGNMVDQNERFNWTDAKYYLGQYTYVTKRIQGMVETILSKDPNCIIVLQSDHGARHILPEMEKSDKLNILNAVYWRGEPIEEIVGHSHIDTMRILLSKTFGLDYPPLQEASDQHISLERVGLKYEQKDMVRYSFDLFTSDIAFEQTGDVVTYTNNVKSVYSTEFSWDILDPSFAVIDSKPYSKENTFTYSVEANGQYWVKAKIRRTTGTTVEKLVGQIEKDGDVLRVTPMDKTCAPIKNANFTFTQRNGVITITTDLDLSDPQLKVKWIVFDDDYNAIQEDAYGRALEFSYEPFIKRSHSIALSLQYTSPDNSYKESYVQSIANVIYDTSRRTFSVSE